MRSDNFFLLLGDWGAPDYESGGCQSHIGDMMKDYVSKQQGKKCLFVGAVGDNFYAAGLKDDGHWKTQWLDRYGTNDQSSSLHNIPWLAVMGNHDVGCEDWGCGCNQGCKQFNGAHRPPGTELFWMAGYYYSYYIPGAEVEIIGIDTNAVDLSHLGGNGMGGGGRAVYQNCGGYAKVGSFLNQMKSEGEQHLDSRARDTKAKTVLIMQHYPGVGAQYKSRFDQNNAGRSKALSAYGHAHSQRCESHDPDACDVILTGGGGGWFQGGGPWGFVAVHLTDDGGFKTVWNNVAGACGKWLSDDNSSIVV